MSIRKYLHFYSNLLLKQLGLLHVNYVNEAETKRLFISTNFLSFLFSFILEKTHENIYTSKQVPSRPILIHKQNLLVRIWLVTKNIAICFKYHYYRFCRQLVKPTFFLMRDINFKGNFSLGIPPTNTVETGYKIANITSSKLYCLIIPLCT